MQTQVPASGLPFPTVPEVIFTNWREVLHCSGLTPGMQAVYTMAVSGYLEYCGRNAVSVTEASAQAYMDEVIRRGLAKHPELWKDGINWFFREGRQHCGTAPRLVDHALPSLGQADTGAQPWERRLIERLRIQHYAWRTEKTYREWAWRLADFIRPRDLESATGEDLKSFLSGCALTATGFGVFMNRTAPPRWRGCGCPRRWNGNTRARRLPGSGFGSSPRARCRWIRTPG